MQQKKNEEVSRKYKIAIIIVYYFITMRFKIINEVHLS